MERVIRRLMTVLMAIVLIINIGIMHVSATEVLSATTEDLVTSQTDITDINTDDSMSEISEMSSDTTENNISTETTETTDLEHQHMWQVEYSMDEKNHWYACSDCDEKKELAAHIPGDEATETTPQTCIVCGYVIQPVKQLKNIETLTYQSLAGRTYTREEIKPVVNIKDGKSELKLGTDYTVAYQDNINIGQGIVIVEGIGSYKGTKTLKFNIVPKNINASNVKISDVGTQIYTGKVMKPSIKLTHDDKVLELGKDYMLTYKKNESMGRATVIIEGIGNYKSKKTKTFAIVPKQVVNLKAAVASYNSIRLTWDKVSNVTGYRVYRSTNGKNFSCIATLKGSNILTYTDKNLTTGKNYYYKVRAYFDDTNINKRYYGVMSDIVKIKPTVGKVTIKSIVNSSAKKATLTWNKVTGATGYEIYQSESENGTYTRVKTVTSGSTLTFTKAKLESKKTYYYKMRAFRTVDGSKKYGSYSAIKNVTMKDWTKEIVNSYLEEMTLEEKVAQLFVITPESLTGVGKVVRAGDTTKKAIQNYPVGGLIYFAQNIQSKEQFIQMIQQTQSFMQERANMKAFTAIDEEGGTVARISGNPNTGVPALSSMNEIGASGDLNQAYEIGKTIGEYLSEFQINLDFAPVADIANLEGSIMLERSFGTDAQLVGNMVAAEVRGFREKNMICALKHFPGLGYTMNDTHLGYVKTDRTKGEMEQCEFIPFEKGIEAGADIVMVGHVSVPNLTGDATPSSLSKVVITDILRTEMGFEGLVVTDALSMKGVSTYYTSSQAAVKALEAGVDILLMPQDFKAAYNGVLRAVKNGKITEERINQSVYRILKLKVEKGLA